MSRSVRIFFSWTIPGLLLPGMCPSQTPQPFRDPLPRLIRMETRIDSLRMHGERLQGEAELLAERIHLYRGKKDLNAREHGNLEKLLRRAQALSAAVSESERGIDAALGAYGTFLDSALGALETEMTRMLSGETDPASVDHVREILDRKAVLESRRKPLALSAESGRRIALSPTEPARSLRLKGDILLDREHLYREEIRLIDRRIRSLGIEANVRRKVRRMASELDLFSEGDELIARSGGLRESSQPSNELDYWDGRENLWGSGSRGSNASLNDPPLGDESAVRPESRTPEMIDAAVATLTQHRNRLESLADSLRARSRLFYDEADRRRETSP